MSDADGLERLRRWREQDRGVPPAFGRLSAALDEVGPCRTVVRVPLSAELRSAGDGPSGALVCLVADFGLTTSVIASLPDLRGVATLALTVDHLAAPPATGALVARCTASPYVGGGPQHAAGTVSDASGRPVAAVTGWFVPAAADAVEVERVGRVEEPPAADLRALLGVPPGPRFALHARDALSNALGTLHGGVGALAAQLAGEAALSGRLRPLTSRFSYLRPTPRDGSVAVAAEVVRQGRTTGVASATVTSPDGRLVLTGELVVG